MILFCVVFLALCEKFMMVEYNYCKFSYVLRIVVISGYHGFYNNLNKQSLLHANDDRN